MEVADACTQIMRHNEIIVHLKEIREKVGEGRKSWQRWREKRKRNRPEVIVWGERRKVLIFAQSVSYLFYQTNCLFFSRLGISTSFQIVCMLGVEKQQVILWPGGPVIDPRSHELPTGSPCTEVNLRKALDLCQLRGELMLTANSDLLWEAFRWKAKLPPWK